MTKYYAKAQITVGSHWPEKLWTGQLTMPTGGDEQTILVDFDTDREGTEIVEEMSNAIRKELKRDDWHLWYWWINKA